mgnify:CR=1 FL=1
MKKKRGLFVILAGVVLLCVLIVCYVALLKVNSSEGKTTEEETAQEEAAAIASDDISTLTFERGIRPSPSKRVKTAGRWKVRRTFRWMLRK